MTPLPRVSRLEERYVLEVLRSEFRTSAGGAMTKRLEERFAQVFGTSYAISLVNGTATMHSALVAAGVGPGDEVIVPPLTMASTTFAVLHTGAVPVFADVDPLAWTVSPTSIEERLTERTKAIIPVAIYGLPPDLDAIMGIAARHGLFVLEDDAQCFLGRYKGRVLGSIGHASSFSFQSSKHMTCGEGGMVTTNDPELADRLRRFSSLGYAAVGGEPGEGNISKDVIQDPDYERHESLGWNYRMSELCSAVALAQLERLPELVEMRVKVGALLAEASRGCSWLIPQYVPADSTHSYWTFAVLLDSGDSSTWREFRKTYMQNGGDGVYAAWQLTYLEPALRGRRFSPHQSQVFAPGLCPVAESLQPRLLQFRTNYFDVDVAAQKAEALARTIDQVGGRYRPVGPGRSGPSPRTLS